MDPKVIVSLVVVVRLVLILGIKNVPSCRYLVTKKIELRLTVLFTLRLFLFRKRHTYCLQIISIVSLLMAVYTIRYGN
jgi:hypothetical protein